MTELWREFRTVSIVGVLTTGVAGAFPISALDFKADGSHSSCEASAAFIELTIEEEIAALKAAKSAWQSETSALERMRVRLPLGELPEEEIGAPLDLPDATRFALTASDPVDYPFPAAASSQAASSPARLLAEPEARLAPTFSREDLLDLTERE